MFRFGNEDGTPFHLDFIGSVYAFDSYNRKVAVCHMLPDEEMKEILRKEPDFDPEDLETASQHPEDWSNWELLIDVHDDLECDKEVIYKRALCTSFAACCAIQRMTISWMPTTSWIPIS